MTATGTEVRGRRDARGSRWLLPMPEARTPWAGGTKDRLVANATLDTSPEVERLVLRAVMQAKAGDDEALRFLYLRYADNVYGYVRTIVRDHHDAKDVTQQVFAKLLTTIVKYEQRGTPFIAWLLRMSHNVAVDAVRARRTTPAAQIHGLDESFADDVCERARSLRAAFAALPEDQRQVVVLRHVLGRSPVEIAAQLGRTSSSVYGLHHRGRRARRAELERLDASPLTASRGRVSLAA